MTKRLLFNANTRTKIGRPTETLEDKVMKSSGLTKDAFYKEALMLKGRMVHQPRRTTDSYQTDNTAKQASTSTSKLTRRYSFDVDRKLALNISI